MRNLLTIIFNFFCLLLGKRNLERFLIFGIKTLKVDLYPHAIIQKGFTGWENYDITCERNLLNLIKNKFIDVKCCFDIGANNGSYSLMLNEIFPEAAIHSFEPFPNTYSIAVKALKKSKNIYLNKIAVGEYKGKLKLFNDLSSPNDQLSTSYPSGLTDFYNSKNISETEVDVTTLDQYCARKKINTIDFLKIDVEGAELAVLKGCYDLLNKGNVKIIQFEFNNFNISSRTFLKDFYEILPNYTFFRVSKSELVSLGSYSTSNEVFRFQNILAVNPNIAFPGN